MRLPALALLFLVAVSAAIGSGLIEVDVSDPNAVVFRTTGAAASLDDSSATVTFGIDLLTFFKSTGATLGSIQSTGLYASNTEQPYTNWRVDNASSSYIDLNLSRARMAGETALPQVFSTESGAFTGEAVINLSTYSSLLPQIGTYGSIVAGRSASGISDVIGEWTVVPEPSTYAAFFGVGALATAVVLRRRRS